FRVQVIEISACINKGAARLAHFGSIDGQEAVHTDFGRRTQLGRVQHGRPEQGVEVDDVFADKVIHLGSGVRLPVVFPVDAVVVTVVFQAGDITDWSIQPDIKIFA